MHTALTQCFQTSKQMSEDTTDLYYYLLGLVLPLIFFEVDALCGDPMRRNGILKSSESLKCSAQRVDPLCHRSACAYKDPFYW